MRTLVVTEDLVDAAWNFTLKSARVGHIPVEAAKAKAKGRANRLGFRQKLNMTVPVSVGIFLSTLLLLFVLWAVEDSELRFARGGGWILEKGAAGSTSIPWRIQERVNVGGVHGMGVVFGQENIGGRRRRRSMSELIVAHMTEHVTDSELGMFVRTLYRSGALARADLVILFPANSFTENASNVIQQECDLGRKKLNYCFHSPGASCNDSASNSLSVFNAAAFKEAADEYKERKRGDPGGVVVGSVTAFEMEELDAANILQDFVDDPPAQLRRWVCYQLLLGFLRHKYTTVLLARIGGVVILGDALAAARKSKANAGGLLLLAEPRSWDLPGAAAAQNRRCWKHRTAHKAHTKSQAPTRRNKIPTVVEAVYGAEVWRSLSGDVKRRRLISSGVIAGATGAVRALANAMVNEIVRLHLHLHPHLCGEALPDHVLLSYLVHVSSVLGRKLTDSLQLVDNSCQLSFAYSVAGGNRTLTELLSKADVRHGAVDGLSENGKSASFVEMIRQDLCGSPNDGNLYPDCLL